jgi:hypothetical protein
MAPFSIVVATIGLGVSGNGSCITNVFSSPFDYGLADSHTEDYFYLELECYSDYECGNDYLIESSESLIP